MSIKSKWTLGLIGTIAMLASGCSFGAGEAETTAEEEAAHDDAYAFGPSVEADQAGAHPTRGTSGIESQVLNQVNVPRLGTLSLIDEDPSSSVPQISVLLVSSPDDDLLLPLVHEDGTEITPLEYLMSVDSAAEVSPRLLLQHISITGGTQAFSVVYNAPPQVTNGSCESSAWMTYFDAAASDFGGVGTPSHVLDANTSSPSWKASAYLGKYARIVTGACFKSASGDGNDDLTVRMERQVDGDWQLVAGTQVELNTTINGGKDRYLYLSGASCYDYDRRITVYGRPPGGIYSADKFHLSGAWGGQSNGCWITP